MKIYIYGCTILNCTVVVGSDRAKWQEKQKRVSRLNARTVRGCDLCFSRQKAEA